MLEVSRRTGSYFAILWSPEGEVVLDVSASTCIFSFMAARDGARLVFAREATDMQGTVETILLMCEVDVIVSEWMGHLLLRESMLGSVLVACDRFLLLGGSLFPSHATLHLAPLSKAKAVAEKRATWEQRKQHWAKLTSVMNT